MYIRIMIIITRFVRSSFFALALLFYYSTITLSRIAYPLHCLDCILSHYYTKNSIDIEKLSRNHNSNFYLRLTSTLQHPAITFALSCQIYIRVLYMMFALFAVSNFFQYQCKLRGFTYLWNG